MDTAIKPFLMTYFYVYRSASTSLNWGIFFFAVDGKKHRNSQLDNVQWVRNFGALNLKQDTFITHLPLEFSHLCSARGRKNVRARGGGQLQQTPFSKQQDKFTQRLWHQQKKFKSDRILSQRRYMNSLTPNKKPSVED